MKAKELAEILLRFPDKEVMVNKFFIEGDYDIAVGYGTTKMVPLTLQDCENVGNFYIINEDILVSDN